MNLNSRKLVGLAQTLDSFWGQSRNLKKKYRSEVSVASFIKRQSFSSGLGERTLDLGCGECPQNPFSAAHVCGVDIRDDLPRHIVRSNLVLDRIPFEDDSFEYCTAYDFLEHLPRLIVSNGVCLNPFIRVMNEIYRVLRPGGLFFYLSPCFPSLQSFQDPTHVNFITEDTIPMYFCGLDNSAGQLGYGFSGRFELIDQCWIDQAYVAGIVTAIK